MVKGLDGVGRGVKNCARVWGEIRRGVEECWKRCEKVCWGMGN